MEYNTVSQKTYNKQNYKFSWTKSWSWPYLYLSAR